VISRNRTSEIASPNLGDDPGAPKFFSRPAGLSPRTGLRDRNHGRTTFDSDHLREELFQHLSGVTDWEFIKTSSLHWHVASALQTRVENLFDSCWTSRLTTNEPHPIAKAPWIPDHLSHTLLFSLKSDSLIALFSAPRYSPHYFVGAGESRM